jgi:nucleotide-binding universal stress UspA family protein
MRILLPIDESSYSEEAVGSLIATFRPAAAEVRVLNVIEPVTAYLTSGLIPKLAIDSEQIEAERQKQSEALVSAAAQKLRDAGFATSESIERGDGKSVILDSAEKWPADLIVLGCHGLKGIGRFLMGSVSDAVARHAHCSVQIVRKPSSGHR